MATDSYNISETFSLHILRFDLFIYLCRRRCFIYFEHYHNKFKLLVTDLICM